MEAAMGRVGNRLTAAASLEEAKRREGPSLGAINVLYVRMALFVADTAEVSEPRYRFIYLRGLGQVIHHFWLSIAQIRVRASRSLARSQPVLRRALRPVQHRVPWGPPAALV